MYTTTIEVDNQIVRAVQYDTMFQLEPLPYNYNALDPFIDEETMRIHHDKHHAAYIDNLNKALSDFPDLNSQSIESLIKNLDTLPEKCKTAVRNHGGGHLNHTFFWNILTPNHGQKPEGELHVALIKTFGSLDDFYTQFESAGLTRFGSGWVWLVVNTQKGLEIVSTANQDNPLSEEKTPILGVDVWEHAYYLKYQNKRAEYLKQIWNVINYRQIEENFLKAHS